jgi:hypothetical protein
VSGKLQNRAERKLVSAAGLEFLPPDQTAVNGLAATIKSEPSINPLFDGLFILTIFPFPVRTFPSPSLTWLNRPFAVDRPSRDDRCSTFMPKTFVHVRMG